MIRPGRLGARSTTRALLLAAGLCTGPAHGADADAARALMGLAEDRQRAQDAARVLERLGAPTHAPLAPSPAAVATAEPPVARPVTTPADPPAPPKPAHQAAVAPDPKAPPSAPSTAVPALPSPGTNTAPAVAALPPPAPLPPRIEPPPAKPEPAPTSSQREARQPAAPAGSPDETPDAIPEKPSPPPPVLVIPPPPRETAPTARPDGSAAPRREPPAPVLAARAAEEPAPSRPPITSPITAPIPATEVYFGYGSITLSDASVAALLPLGEDRAGAGTITIVGHTDALEKDTLDRRFSERRAEAVRRFLVATLGFDPKRLVVRGVGAERPKVRGDLPSPQNRRVEILSAPVSPPSSGRSSLDRPSPDRPSPDRAR